jgi:GNAT superfamily N-acetyltransferase
MITNCESAAFAQCYKMTENDIDAFAECLAKGFKNYPLFEYASLYKYDIEKAKSFWSATLKIVGKYGLCYASDRRINSVMIYLPPETHEPGAWEYIQNNCLREILSTGLIATLRLVRFDAIANSIANRHKTKNCGYLMAIATLPEMQKAGQGKKLLNALIAYLNISHQDCYLETLKAGNVPLYEHFNFTLKETSHKLSSKLPIFAMLYKSLCIPR